MSNRKKRRKWSDEEKREICQQAVLPGASVAQIARRYSANANVIYNWLKDPRFAPDAEDLAMPTDASFIELDVSAAASHSVPDIVATPAAALSANKVDITLSDGRRVLIEGPMSLGSIIGLVQGLMA
ncbi:IS66-like element accessory protein TnpA [Leisingera sp. S232]|uniref:IS66-like element accessory protein TnpA n=1 Tax=Leisingera sp. S232 TaxID=3415132 RepID=UPI003C7E1597